MQITKEESRNKNNIVDFLNISFPKSMFKDGTKW